MKAVLASDWGRLFRNWEHLSADDNGFPSVGTDAAQVSRTGLRALLTSLKVLATCLWEAPEFAARLSAAVALVFFILARGYYSPVG
jgi:hypothetical protein